MCLVRVMSYPEDVVILESAVIAAKTKKQWIVILSAVVLWSTPAAVFGAVAFHSSGSDSHLADAVVGALSGVAIWVVASFLVAFMLALFSGPRAPAWKRNPPIF